LEEADMGDDLRNRIEEMKEILWRKHRTVVDMPDGVPEDLQLRLIEEDLARIEAEGDDDPYLDDCPICQAMKSEGMLWTRHLDFCTGWCPGCEVLTWCATANENHTPEEIAWMKEHNDFPPRPVEN
jgi:hypothetical protein